MCWLEATTLTFKSSATCADTRNGTAEAAAAAAANTDLKFAPVVCLNGGPKQDARQCHANVGRRAAYAGRWVRFRHRQLPHRP
jgi:hypothetical protein